MKKTKALQLKKITLQHLDEPQLAAVAAAGTGGAITGYVTCLCSQLACLTKKTCEKQ